MKNYFRTNIVIALCLLIAACGQVSQVTPSTVPSIDIATETPSPTVTFLPTATATIESTPRPEYVQPTLFPTIDPTLVPGLLSKAFSVQTMEGVNGHKMQRITGWEYGLGGGFFHNSCIGYIWLDTNHLLLYPATGQVNLPEGWSPTKFNVVRQPVVINLENGHIWLPPVKAPESPEICDIVEWSSELGVLILPEEHDGISTISTYTYDGHKLASYTGNLVDVSPSGTKIFLRNNTIIDLRTNKRVTLDWGLQSYPEDHPFYNLVWTSDETRIYRCCYFYADLTTGTSYSSTRSDFQDTDDNHQEPWGMVNRGGWIQNDTYFLPEWNWLDDGDIRYLPMLAPARKLAIEVREKAGIPEDWSCTDIDTSPDGKYVWMTGFNDSYLVDLITFEAQYYPRKKYSGVDWSPNSKFVFLSNNDLSDETEPYSILSVIDKQLRFLPVAPLSEWIHWWHKSDDILIYPSEDENTLLLDLATMSFRELPFKVDAGGYDSLIWSPNGEFIALTAEDGSLWQVDYPKLENLEQLTEPMPNMGSVAWSPDGNSIAFVSGSDIYIVDVSQR